MGDRTLGRNEMATCGLAFRATALPRARHALAAGFIGVVFVALTACLEDDPVSWNNHLGIELPRLRAAQRWIWPIH